MGEGIFITGTGTDVGKTYVTALLIRKLRASGVNAGYFKAALSGAELVGTEFLPGDACYVKERSGLAEDWQNMVSYLYKTPVSPHLAAKLEGNPVRLDKIKKDYGTISSRYSYMVVEGSGGIVCPIRWDGEQKILLEDIIRELGLAALVVADSGLGTINATVLTVEYLKNRLIPVCGIIMNRFHYTEVMEEDNRHMIEMLTGVPVIAVVREQADDLELDIEKLISKNRCQINGR